MSQTDLKTVLSDAQYLSLGQYGDLDTIEINHPTCKAAISLFGAHLLSFTPSSDNINRLWLSPSSVSNGSKPIRGGVPVCWPWFAANQPKAVDEYCAQHNLKAPSHGYARTQIWQLDEFEENDNFAELRLSPTEVAQFSYCSDFSVQLIVRFASECKMDLITHNQSTSSVEFGAALHSYFAVEDIKNVRLEGVNSEYQDKTQGFVTCPAQSPYLINKEVDRIHGKDHSEDVEVINIAKSNESLSNIQVTNQGNNAAVIWNPWVHNSQALPDMQDDGYKTMVCVESAIVAPIKLSAMQSHCLSQTIK